MNEELLKRCMEMESVSAIFRNAGLCMSYAIHRSAEVLRDDQVPGQVSIGILAVLIVFTLSSFFQYRKRINAIRWLRNEVRKSKGKGEFVDYVMKIDRNLKSKNYYVHAMNAWASFRKSLILEDAEDAKYFRNTIRPSFFFNLEDLNCSPGFYRYLPGLFVSVGLLLTFLGLISALQVMKDNIAPVAQQGIELGPVMDLLVTENTQQDPAPDPMAELLAAASAKFIMSLTGLFASIVFTITLRIMILRVDTIVRSLCDELEARLSPISLEEMAAKQLEVARNQEDSFKRIGMELVEKFGTQMREDMTTLMGKVGEVSSDGVGDMVKELSTRISGDVGRSLSEASEQISAAGEKVAMLVESIGQNSGRMGQEMESAVSQLAQAADQLKGHLAAAAEKTDGTLAAGTERILAAVGEAVTNLSDRMDQSSGRMSQEMENAVGRLAQAAEDMRTHMAAAAEATDGALNAGTERLLSSLTEAVTSLSDRMDQSSGRMGQEMENAANRLAGIADEVTGRLSAAAETTDGTLSAGAEKILAVMNEGLDGIRKNTAEGSKALQAAAADMRAAAEMFREQMDAAAKSGAEGVRDHMKTVGGEVGSAITEAGVGVVDAVERSGEQMLSASSALKDKLAKDLIAPVDEVIRQFGQVAEKLSEGSKQIEMAALNIRASGEEARKGTDAVSAASQSLKAATEPIQGSVERIEGAVDGLSKSTEQASEAIVESSREIAKEAERVFASVHSIIAGERDLLAASLARMGDMLEQMESQWRRLDKMDEQLGKAFTDFRASVKEGLDILETHVKKMNSDLSPALDKMREIVQHAEEFIPKSRR